MGVKIKPYKGNSTAEVPKMESKGMPSVKSSPIVKKTMKCGGKVKAKKKK